MFIAIAAGAGTAAADPPWIVRALQDPVARSTTAKLKRLFAEAAHRLPNRFSGAAL
jgi:hypothetical protein